MQRLAASLLHQLVYNCVVVLLKLWWLSEGRKKSDGADGKEEDEVPTEEIVPPFRRDCQSEVYCGSHTYPGRGVYLLKFDNSYSLWRSKMLYYRVYYTRWASMLVYG